MKVQHSPLYAQLVKVFEDNIRREVWRVGASIPSEGELSRQFGVSVGTARKALEVMEQVGWITRRQGRGTFVSDPTRRCAGRLSQVLMNDDTDVFSACESSLLEQHTRIATPEEMTLLKCIAGSKVTRVQRLFTRQCSPVMFEDILVCGKGDVGIQEIPQESDTFQMVMAQRISEVGNVVEEYSALLPPEKIAIILNRPPKTVLLRCRQMIEDEDGVPFAVCDRWIVTESAYCKRALN